MTTTFDNQEVEVLIDDEWVLCDLLMGADISFGVNEPHEVYVALPKGFTLERENYVYAEYFGDPERDTIRTPRRQASLMVNGFHYYCPYCNKTNNLEALPQGDTVQCEYCYEIADIDTSREGLYLPTWGTQ